MINKKICINANIKFNLFTSNSIFMSKTSYDSLYLNGNYLFIIVYLY